MKKPLLDFWQIWNMTIGFLGIQFGFALQNANVSRIFETLGASIDDIPILWIAAPVTGLIIQPIVGHMSDHTWNKLGRRRPYFLWGAIFSTLALFIMPNSGVLWIAACMLWILDASINISMEPMRALVGDMLPNSQRTTGFALQSFFIGTGAIIASALPWILTNMFKVENTAPAGMIPLSVQLSFYLGAIVFFLAVLWTILKTKEYTPAELEACSEEKYIKEKKGILQIWHDFIKMPKTMIQLAFVQFFSWFGLFCMWIYSTSAVTTHIYHATDHTSAIYNDGANWVGICFAFYNGFAAIIACFLPFLSKLIKRKLVHTLCLILGGMGLISIYFISNPLYLIFSMLGIGIAWASILSIPYAILAGSLPGNKMGLYMGIFNFFIVIPQIVAAGILGPVTKIFFNGNAIYTIILGGLSMIIAGLTVIQVKDKNE